jgi:serine/threonine protein phosphatase 1
VEEQSEGMLVTGREKTQQGVIRLFVAGAAKGAAKLTKGDSRLRGVHGVDSRGGDSTLLLCRERRRIRQHFSGPIGTNMPGRTIAIGDIHGCLAALDALICAIAPGPEDTLITLGDYIDRGPHSRGVLDRLVTLARRCRLVPLIGNHEELLLAALADITALRRWITLGGADTLRSYGWVPGGPRRALAEWIPAPHREFLAGCRSYYETRSHIYVHAGFVPELPLNEQPVEALRWRVANASMAVPHCSGKVVVLGHTPQLSGEVLDLGFLVCIDTNCARGGCLTALDADTGRIWQADRRGKLREPPTGDP